MVTRLALLDDRRGDWTLNEGVRDAALGGDSVQPPAEADQRPGSAVQIPNPVEPAPPAAQRPGIGQMPDRLLHQRAQPRLAAVVGPLPVREPVLGRRSPTGACQCSQRLAMPRNPRSSRLATPLASSTSLSPDSVTSSCSWQLP